MITKRTLVIRVEYALQPDKQRIVDAVKRTVPWLKVRAKWEEEK